MRGWEGISPDVLGRFQQRLGGLSSSWAAQRAKERADLHCPPGADTAAALGRHVQALWPRGSGTYPRPPRFSGFGLGWSHPLRFPGPGAFGLGPSHTSAAPGLPPAGGLPGTLHGHACTGHFPGKALGPSVHHLLPLSPCHTGIDVHWSCLSGGQDQEVALPGHERSFLGEVAERPRPLGRRQPFPGDPHVL